jgi:hypothetical protein
MEYKINIILKYEKIVNKLILQYNYYNKVYLIVKNIFNKKVEKNKIMYDILDPEELTKYLLISLKIKHIQMKYGLLWQKIIGAYNNFKDLKIGNKSGLDIISEERKIVIELKNRYNTDNAASKKTNFDKLALFKKNNPEYKCVYGIINDKREEGKFLKILHNEQEIYYYSANKLFELIYEDNYKEIINSILKIIKKSIYKYILNNFNLSKTIN